MARTYILQHDKSLTCSLVVHREGARYMHKEEEKFKICCDVNRMREARSQYMHVGDRDYVQSSKIPSTIFVSPHQSSDDVMLPRILKI